MLFRSIGVVWLLALRAGIAYAFACATPPEPAQGTRRGPNGARRAVVPLAALAGACGVLSDILHAIRTPGGIAGTGADPIAAHGWLAGARPLFWLQLSLAAAALAALVWWLSRLAAKFPSPRRAVTGRNVAVLCICAGAISTLWSVLSPALASDWSTLLQTLVVLVLAPAVVIAPVYIWRVRTDIARQLDPPPRAAAPADSEEA